MKRSQVRSLLADLRQEMQSALVALDDVEDHEERFRYAMLIRRIDLALEQGWLE